MSKIIFVIPSLSDSHFRNRIIEFVEQGYDVEVFGYIREGQKKVKELPYMYNLLGTLHDESYKERVRLYYKTFRTIGEQYRNQDVLFYLCGLDIAMFFHYLNPLAHYIFEECDLVHTYLGMLKVPLEWIDKRIIKKSLLTVTTSEGFINYHFNGNCPENVVLVENKLNPSILECKIKEKKPFSQERIEMGFVGTPRFDSVYNFIDVFCKNFPNGTFHVFGGPILKQFEPLKKYKNCIFHGFFKNPVDLPEIYAGIDVVVATYDTKFENVRYAEPNKIYESVYFETPIVVSSGTFLAEKVRRLGIGYDIDAMKDEEIIRFVKGLSEESLHKKIVTARSIDKKEMLNINDFFFEKLAELV